MKKKRGRRRGRGRGAPQAVAAVPLASGLSTSSETHPAPELVAAPPTHSLEVAAVPLASGSSTSSDTRPAPELVAAAPTHSLTRARELANPNARVTAVDFTAYIGREHRRLDTLARLLRLNTTTCAAVAIDPRIGRIVVAANEMDDATEAQIRALFVAFAHLHQDAVRPKDAVIAPSVNLDDRRVLYTLFNKIREYDYVLRIVDGIGTEPNDFIKLRDYYRQRLLKEQRKRPLDAGNVGFLEASIALIDARNIAEIIANERDPRSRYGDFIGDDITHTTVDRMSRDIAKLASAFGLGGGLGAALSMEPIILRPPSFSAPDEALRVHAEMQIAEYFLNTPPNVLPNYIGVSMHCCRTCGACMNVLYDRHPLAYRGESLFVFKNVTLPPKVQARVTAASIDPGVLPIYTVAGLGGSQEHARSRSVTESAHSEETARTRLVGHATQAGRAARMAPPAAAAAAQPVVIAAPVVPLMAHRGGRGGRGRGRGVGRWRGRARGQVGRFF